MSDPSAVDKVIPTIGISIWDLNGIGPEITLKAFRSIGILTQLTLVIYASAQTLSFYQKILRLSDFKFHEIQDLKEVAPGQVNLLSIWQESLDFQPGKPSSMGGKYAKISLDQSVNDLKKKVIDGLVTAPISKELIQKEGFDFPVHTEFLASVFGLQENLMLMVNNQLRIGVVTGHIPLKKISSMLTKSLITSKLEIFLNSLITNFGIKNPKIALTGVNQHAGENGLIGSEEQEVIIPVIKEFQAAGHLVFGPYPADGFFGDDQFKNFDGILTMYHDQGLIPFKHISMGAGVNFTAGIPAIRTSPAHGTAFDIAGKNIANPLSMINALYIAADLAMKKLSLP